MPLFAGSTLLWVPRGSIGPVLPSAAAGEELGQVSHPLGACVQGQWRHLSLTTGVQPAPPFSHPQGQLTLAQRTSSALSCCTAEVLHSLLSAAASERQDQFSLAQPVRGRVQLCIIQSSLWFCGIESHGLYRPRLQQGHEPRYGPCSSPGPDITTHLCLLLTVFTFSDTPLSNKHEPFPPSVSVSLTVCLSPIPQHAFVHHSSLCLALRATLFVLLGRTLLLRIIMVPNCVVPEVLGRLL